MDSYFKDPYTKETLVLGMWVMDVDGWMDPNDFTF